MEVGCFEEAEEVEEVVAGLDWEEMWQEGSGSRFPV